MKLISLSSSWMFCSKYIFRGQRTCEVFPAQRCHAQIDRPWSRHPSNLGHFYDGKLVGHLMVRSSEKLPTKYFNEAGIW